MITFTPSLTSSAPLTSILLLVFHGMLAFTLNIANFNAVKEGGPLMMNVVGNVKQVVMIILSVFMFGSKMTVMGVIGSVICIMGSMWYTSGRCEKWTGLMSREHQEEQDDERCVEGRADHSSEQGEQAGYCLIPHSVFLFVRKSRKHIA